MSDPKPLPLAHAPPWAPDKNAPGVWDGGRFTPDWTITATGATATWTSPRFDLRPEFLATMNERPTRVQPIWRPAGAGGQLFIQVVGLQTAVDSTSDLAVRAREFASPNFSLGGLPQISLQEITAEFITESASTLLIFVPPGEGYPVRYWQVDLTLTFTAVHAVYPTFTILAAYY